MKLSEKELREKISQELLRYYGEPLILDAVRDIVKILEADRQAIEVEAKISLLEKGYRKKDFSNVKPN